MKITVLSENTTSSDNLMYEHGLSLYIEACSHRILFDMGQSDLFYHNAHKLNIDLSKVDTAVLSHGHYDHGGGLKKFLEINSQAKVYLSRYAFEPHYNGEKYIGLDETLSTCERLVFTLDELRLFDGATLYSCNDKPTVCDIDSTGLSVKRGGVLSPDTFLHEQYLMIEENGHKVLISGCSHKGILNICSFFDADTIVGGLHVSKWSLDKVEALAKKLDSSDIDYYTCHCTGYDRYEYMKRYMSRLRYISTGDTIEI